MTKKLVVALSMSLVLVACKKKVPEPDAAPPTTTTTQAAPATPRPVPVEAIQELVANFARVHFETDSNELDVESRRALTDNAGILKEHRGLVVEIQGHADERGTTDYNLALGQRRADAVKAFLVTQGVSDRQMQTFSFGEERPLASGHQETAWSENRRAEFRIVVPDGNVGGTVQ